MSSDCVFAIDFTQEDMTAAFVTLDGDEVGTAGFGLIDFLAGESEPLDKLTALLLAKARTAPGAIRALALSLPCDLNRDRNTVVNFPEASWLNGCRLPEMLESALGVAAVMERRAVALLAYDRAMLGLPEDALVVGCYVDTHYDSAIWHCGRPVLGKNGAAGNIAHMTVHDREDNCFCGKSGCVDLYGAGIRLRQMHTMIFPDTPLPELFEAHGEHPIVQDYLAMMAYPIAIEANILDPDFLVIGGSIPSMRGFPRTLLEEQIRRHSYRPDPGHQAVFLPSAAGSVSGVTTAAQYAVIKLDLLG